MKEETEKPKSSDGKVVMIIFLIIGICLLGFYLGILSIIIFLFIG